MNKRDALRAARTADRLAREYALTLIASAINCADPNRAADRAGYWLERFRGRNLAPFVPVSICEAWT